VTLSGDAVAATPTFAPAPCQWPKVALSGAILIVATATVATTNRVCFPDYFCAFFALRLKPQRLSDKCRPKDA